MQSKERMCNPKNEATKSCWMAAPRSDTLGHYSDGAAKGHGTHLLVTEPSGACNLALTRLLRDTSKAIGLPGIHDSTVYGTSRASTRSFFSHHLAAISSAIVNSDALTLLNHASNAAFMLTLAAHVNTPAGATGGRHA